MAKSFVHRFPCGCQWPVVGPPPAPGALPLMDVDDNHLPDCPAVWEMLGRGHTKGVFQLESRLGRQWTKRLKPTSVEHLCALGAILRPGCLRAVEERTLPDGKKARVSATEVYCRRKNGEEEVASVHPVVDAVLAKTYGVLVFQEQSMQLAQAVAGFDLQQADALRKAIGKKLPEEMAKCRRQFLEGVEKAGVIPKDLGESLWSSIEKSQRYAFNKSHSMSYGLLGYDTAYIKAHFPAAFFANWLYYADYKPDPREENAELVEEARLLDLAIDPPDLRDLDRAEVREVSRDVRRWYDSNGRVICESVQAPPGYESAEAVGTVTDEEVFGPTTDGARVRFGLKNVKGVGRAQAVKVFRAYEAGRAALGKPLADWSWAEYLFRGSAGVSPAVLDALVSAGAFRWTGKTRTRLKNELRAWDTLTDNERKWVVANCDPAGGVAAALRAAARPKREGGACANGARVAAVGSAAAILEAPPASEADSPHFLAHEEERLLGIALTCSRVDGFDPGDVNCTCREFLAGRTGYLVLGVEVRQAREVRTRTGKNPGQPMAFLEVSDGTCGLSDVTVFPEAWARFGRLLRPGQCVALQGDRDPKRGSLLVSHAWPLRMEVS